MFTISKSFTFEASHQLLRHDGKCQRLHGHSYSFTLELSGPLIEGGAKDGMVMDYAEVSAVGKEIVGLCDHRHLNDVLQTDMPTAERIAVWIYNKTIDRLPLLQSVSVKETESSECRYAPKEHAHA